MRRNAFGVLLLLLLVGCRQVAPVQTMIVTEAVRTDGERILSLNGFFQGADTVLMNVYHDSDVLMEERVVNTWTLTLSEHDYYTIKFRDGQGRTKYIYVIELSDNQLEYMDPIEIDFDVQGNIAFLKARDGKPDFVAFDVGMSRKRRLEP